MENRKLIVGGICVDNPLFLAPLAGVTLSPIRNMFRNLGIGLVHTEMVSCCGLEQRNGKTGRMLRYDDVERPLVLQLFAGDVDTLVRGAEIALSTSDFDAIGINMACPMPKVLKKGAGSRLLQRPDIAVAMVRRLKTLGLPVWPKIRKFFKGGDYPISTANFCELLLKAGADNIGVHGRTPAQRYEGEADKGSVLSLAAQFPGMISGSGDLFAVEDALEYLHGGCVAVMFARGAIRDPFVIPRTLLALGYNEKAEFLDPPLEKKVEILLQMGDDLERKYSGRVADILVKRFIGGIFKGIPGSTNFRRAIAAIHDWNALSEQLQNWRHFFERGNM